MKSKEEIELKINEFEKQLHELISKENEDNEFNIDYTPLKNRIKGNINILKWVLNDNE